MYSFANRIIDIWNNLPFEIVSVSSIAVFRRKLNTVDFTPFILAKY